MAITQYHFVARLLGFRCNEMQIQIQLSDFLAITIMAIIKIADLNQMKTNESLNPSTIQKTVRLNERLGIPERDYYTYRYMRN